MNNKPLLARFYRDTIDASEAFKGLDRDVIQHAIATGLITVKGRRVTITAHGRELQPTPRKA